MTDGCLPGGIHLIDQKEEGLPVPTDLFQKLKEDKDAGKQKLNFWNPKTVSSDKDLVIVGKFIVNIDTIKYQDIKLFRYIIPASAYLPLKARKQQRLNRKTSRVKEDDTKSELKTLMKEQLAIIESITKTSNAMEKAIDRLKSSGIDLTDFDFDEDSTDEQVSVKSPKRDVTEAAREKAELIPQNLNSF